MLIVGGSGSGKTNTLFNLKNHQPKVDKVYLFAKNSYDPKYQYLLKKCEEFGLKHLKDLKSLIKYSNNMNDAFKSIENYNPGQER